MKPFSSISDIKPRGRMPCGRHCRDIRPFALLYDCWLVTDNKYVAYCVVYFAAVVSGESGDDIYEQVKVVIEEQGGPSVWVPTNQPL